MCSCTGFVGLRLSLQQRRMGLSLFVTCANSKRCAPFFLKYLSPELYFFITFFPHNFIVIVLSTSLISTSFTLFLDSLAPNLLKVSKQLLSLPSLHDDPYFPKIIAQSFGWINKFESQMQYLEYKRVIENPGLIRHKPLVHFWPIKDRPLPLNFWHMIFRRLQH